MPNGHQPSPPTNPIRHRRRPENPMAVAAARSPASSGLIRRKQDLGFTLLALLLFTLSTCKLSVAAAAAAALPETSAGSAAMASISGGVHPDWWKWDDFTNVLKKIRDRVIDQFLKDFELPTSGEIFNWLIKAAKWLIGFIKAVIWDPRKQVTTVVEWIVDSALNPFRTLDEGMAAFRRLFAYIKDIASSTFIWGSKNPVRICYDSFYPGCLAKLPQPTFMEWLGARFYCGYLFYEKCQLHWRWKNGKYHVPLINVHGGCYAFKDCEEKPPI